MTYTDLAVDVPYEDHGGAGAAASLTIGKRRRGHPSGLDSLPLFPGCWPFPLETYDRRTELTAAETTALNAFVAHWFDQFGGLRPISGRYLSVPPVIESLYRLEAPLRAVLAGGSPAGISTALLFDEATVALVLERMQREGVTYWGWSSDVWLDLVGTEAAFKARWRKRNLPCRPRLAAIAYVLGGVRGIVWAKDLVRSFVFGLVFGVISLREATTVIEQVLHSWGYADPNLRRDIGNALATVLLLAGSPRLDSLDYDHLEVARRLAPSVFLRGHFLKLSRALVQLGLLSAPLPLHPEGHPFLGSDPMYRAGVPAEWLSYAERWRDLTTKRVTARRMEFSCILAAGRWLAKPTPKSLTRVSGLTRWPRSTSPLSIRRPSAAGLPTRRRSPAEHSASRSCRAASRGTCPHCVGSFATFRSGA